MARPTLLNDILTQAVCNSLRAGNSRRCAAAAAGVTYATLCNWLMWGRNEKEPYATFFGRIEKVEAEAEAECVEKIRNGLPGWQGSAWWLERRRRRTWKRPVTPVDRDEREDLTKVDDEKLWEAVQALQKEKKTG